MSEQTPGPWSVTHDGQGRPHAWIAGGDGFDAVARVVLAHDDLSGYIPATDRIDADPRALANARLIASAPDLLRALMDVCQYWYATQNPGTLPEEYRRGMQAIARARGEQP